MKQIADEFHDRFKSTVMQSRPKIDPRLETTFDGRVFTARDATHARTRNCNHGCGSG